MESKPKLPLAGISTNTFNNSKINSSTPIPKQNAKERMRRLQAICRKGQDPLSTIKKEITIKSEGKCETRKRKVQHIDTPLGKRFACAQFGGVNQRLTQWMREGTRIIVKLRAFAPGRAQQRGPNRMLQGAIVAFDKHWNLILRDVDEAYFPSLRLGKVQAMPRAMPKSIRYEIEGNAKKGRQILIRHLKCSFITGSSIVMIHEGGQQLIDLFYSMTEDFDRQLRKAFQELQSQILESREKQKNADVTKAAMKQNIRVAEIVKSQLEQIPKDEERSVYRIVGRAFLQETTVSEIDRQNADIKLCNERITLMDRQKDYLAKNIAESEKNLRELIQSRR